VPVEVFFHASCESSGFFLGIDDDDVVAAIPCEGVKEGLCLPRSEWHDRCQDGPRTTPSSVDDDPFLVDICGVAEKVFMEGIPVSLVKGSETEPTLSDGWL